LKKLGFLFFIGAACPRLGGSIRRLSFEKPYHLVDRAFLLCITANMEIEKPPHLGGFVVFTIKKTAFLNHTLMLFIFLRTS